MSVVNFGTSEILDDVGKVISEGKYRVIDVADDVAKNNEKLLLNWDDGYIWNNKRFNKFISQGGF